MLLRHLYIVAAIGVTSALINESKERQRAQRLANKLTDAKNDSMSIKRGEKSHNVASQSRDQNM
jgi:ribosomal protein S7